MTSKSQRSIRSFGKLFWFASLVFFVSGATGLIYQVVWFKRFAHLWGSSSLAFAAVGGSFLFGLGLGAYLIGRKADAVASPLRAYGLCELLIGILALAAPLEIAALVGASSGLHNLVPEQPLARYLVQFSITLLVIGPPCVLMGGTLPLLIRQLTSRDGSIDQATGWLYAINTFGAAAGCYLAGFHLLPQLGMLLTNNLTAAVNILIGAFCLLYYKELPHDARRPPATLQQPPSPLSPRLLALYLAAALSGTAALMLEMTWSRQLALVLGGSTYAYTATLFVVLIGIASGSLLYHAFLKKWASRPGLSVGVIGIMIGSILLGTLLLPKLSQWMAIEAVRESRGSLVWNGILSAAASAIVELLPSIGMGVLFPLFVHLTEASAANVGATVGKVYACNTVGSILGATFTSVLLFPLLGTAGATALAIALYVITLLAMLPWQGKIAWTRLAISGAVGLAAIALAARPRDPRETNLGLYLYGDLGPEWQNSHEVVFFDEGASSNVLVTRRAPDIVSLRVNGKVDASNSIDVATQVGLAYIPWLFQPRPKEILIIGFGSGCTPGHCLQFNNANVTCCELEPAVYAAAPCFNDVSRRPQEFSREWLEARNAELPEEHRLGADEIEKQARFSVVFADGRTVIQASDKKYDLIISEPSNPWVSGCSNLFTKEFFHAAKNRLAPGGVLAQWIQTYGFTLTDYLMIVRTMRSEFPYYGILTFAAEGDTLLLASDKPLIPDQAAIEETQKLVDANPEILAELQAWFGQTDLRQLLLNRYLLGKEQLDEIVDKDKSKLINTDYNMRLEFSAPLRIFSPPDENSHALKALPKAADAHRGKWVAKLAAALGVEGAGTAPFYVALGDDSLAHATSIECATRQRGPVFQSCLQQAVNWYAKALAINSKNKEANAGIQCAQLLNDEQKDRLQLLEQVVALRPNDANAQALLAAAQLIRGNSNAAADTYRTALKLRPHLSYSTRDYTWANDLAWILATTPDRELRNGPEALRWAKAAQAASPNDWRVLDTLAAALAATGDFTGAVKTCELALVQLNDQPELARDLKQRMELYRAGQAYSTEVRN